MKSTADIAREWGVTPERVLQIVRECERKRDRPLKVKIGNGYAFDARAQKILHRFRNAGKA